MSLSVAVLQCELSHLNNPPHLGPSLVVSELEDRGHRVRRLFVHVTRLEQTALELKDWGAELVAIDSIFPLDLVLRFKRALGEVPVVVGGLNSVALFERAPLEYCILGPARKSVAALAEAIEGAELSRVPNLLYRVEGTIHASLVIHEWNLEEELLPFTPPHEWEYRGPSGRHPLADRQGVSLIAEWGCPYQSPARLDEGCRDDARLLRPGAYSDAAWRRVASTYVDDTRGCTFCIFRYQPFEPVPLARSVDLLLVQLRHFWNSGIRSFALQSENPFRLVLPFLREAERAGMRPEEIRLRTMVHLLKAHEAEVESTLREIAAAGTRVTLTQVGFESFVDRSLRLHNKGVTGHDNRRVARFLRQIDTGPGGPIRTIHGHGLILFDPWTTLEEIEENLDAIEADAPFLKSAVSLDSKLYLYSPYAPITRTIRAAGLLATTPYEFGLDFRYCHPEIERYRDLLGFGLGPILEAAGRLGGDAEARRRLAIEGRFRWFRELAVHLRHAAPREGDPRQAAGQLLARVIHDLGLERPAGS